MEDNIKQLKNDYKNALKNATTKDEKKHIKNDYKEMKALLKDSNSLLKDDKKEQKKWNKVWNKLENEYQKLGDAPNIDNNK